MTQLEPTSQPDHTSADANPLGGRHHLGFWLALDTVLVGVFAAVGRVNHSEGLALAGWWHTAWPFLVGLAVGHGVVASGLVGAGVGVVGKAPGSMAAGLVIWPSTVALGMVVRRAIGEGTAVPFVIVATAAVGVLLLSTRLISRLRSRRRRA